MRKYDNAPGICRGVRDCRRTREDYKMGIPLTICSYQDRLPIVCCPNDETTTSNYRITTRRNNGPRVSELSKNDNLLFVTHKHSLD